MRRSSYNASGRIGCLVVFAHIVANICMAGSSDIVLFKPPFYFYTVTAHAL